MLGCLWRQQRPVKQTLNYSGSASAWRSSAQPPDWLPERFRGISRVLKRFLSSAGPRSHAHQLKQVCFGGFQALDYLFKFIVQSRLLYSRATCGMEEDQFRTSVQDLFQSVRLVLSLDGRSCETLLFTQVRTRGSSEVLLFSASASALI